MNHAIFVCQSVEVYVFLKMVYVLKIPTNLKYPLRATCGALWKLVSIFYLFCVENIVNFLELKLALVHTRIIIIIIII